MTPRIVDTGNAFPTTSWMFDNPAPVDTTTWRLRVGGAVRHKLSLTYREVLTIADHERALLDCTSGWYSVQDWHGPRVGWLLDQAMPHANAVAVSFKSVTGYRWSLPLAETRAALLATHVGGEPLSHGHGAPLRLVGPRPAWLSVGQVGAPRTSANPTRLRAVAADIHLFRPPWVRFLNAEPQSRKDFLCLSLRLCAFALRWG